MRRIRPAARHVGSGRGVRRWRRHFLFLGEQAVKLAGHRGRFRRLLLSLYRAGVPGRFLREVGIFV